MKNITDILKELGIEVPEDKTSDLNKAVSENYKTIAEFDKKVKKLEDERDGFQRRAEEAEGTLKDFDGKDFDEITRDRDEWKNKYDNFVREQAEAKEKAELDDAIMTAIKEAKGKNVKAIIAQLDMEAIKTSKNRDKDIANAIKEIADAEDTAFLFETDPEGNRAQFTKPIGNGNGGKTLTKADIYAKDEKGRFKYSTSERQKMISENMDLFN